MGIIKQRVSISVTVEVDVDGWEQDYGVTGAQDIRQDVKAYVDSVIRECNPNLKVVK